jgi:hypothetical protein
VPVLFGIYATETKVGENVQVANNTTNTYRGPRYHRESSGNDDRKEKVT